MSQEKQCECCHEWWYDSDVKENLCPNCYDYFNQLKQQLAESFTEEDVEGLIEDRNKTIKFLQQQLAEKDIRIEELEGQFAYECECNMQLVDLQKQLEEKQKTIDEINKEFVQAVHDWKTLCAEKDKEIETLKQELEEINAGYDFTYEQSSGAIKELKQNQIQLAIQELEKVKDYICDCTYIKEPDYTNVRRKIDQQIKELKGEKDVKD